MQVFDSPDTLVSTSENLMQFFDGMEYLQMSKKIREHFAGEEKPAAKPSSPSGEDKGGGNGKAKPHGHGSVKAEPAETDETRGRKKKSSQVLELLKDHELIKFRGNPFLINGNQALEIGGLQYRDYIARLYYLNYGSGLTENQIKETVLIQRGKALYEGTEKTVYFRNAAISETLVYIDLADGKNTIIEVTPGVWKAAENPDVVFFRPQNIGPLPFPNNPGNIEPLRNFLNLKNDQDFILIRAALPFILRGRPGGRGSYLILLFTGPEGSAKSTAAKILKLLVDPGTPETRTPGNDIRDFFIACFRCLVLNLDNLSHLPRDVQDAISSIVTGGGFARKLNYSDSEEMVFENCNPVFMTGISLKTAPDLMSRTIKLELDPIEEMDRRTESDIYGELEKVKSEIFGGILTALARALAEYKKGFDVPPLPRLADFGKFSIALERGNGYPEGEVIAALSDAYDTALEGIAEENPLINVLLNKLIFSTEQEISGTAGEILKIINHETDEKTQRLEIWPKTAAGLGTIFSRQYNVLKKIGITITKGTGRDRRKYFLSYIEPPFRGDREGESMGAEHETQSEIPF